MKQMRGLRPVEFFCILDADHCFRPIRKKGFFHMWGTYSTTSDDLFVSSAEVRHYTVAIVEDEDGQIYHALPHGVRFTDRAVSLSAEGVPAA